MAELNAIVDLSHDNGLVTFAKAKKTGLLGAIHKATQGTQYPDPKIRSIDLGAANDPVLIQLLVLASADATVTNLVETPVRWRNSRVLIVRSDLFGLQRNLFYCDKTQVTSAPFLLPALTDVRNF